MYVEKLMHIFRSVTKQTLALISLVFITTFILPIDVVYAQIVEKAIIQARSVTPPEGTEPGLPGDSEPLYNSGRMVSQSVPDSMVVGQVSNVSITMQNTGTLAWDRSTKYLLAPQDGSYVWGTTRGELPSSPVLPGATTTINFPITAPSTPGTYLFQWRMVQEWVEWFGTPTVAVMITVTAPPNNARMVSQVVPTSVVAGQVYPVSITMQNTGTLPWDQSTKYLLAPQDGSYVWGTTRGELPSSPVLPSATTTISFPITAPSTPGTYLFQWRMVQEWVEWFGAPTTAVMITVTQGLGNVTFIHTDGLGSPVARTDGAGNLISRTYYEPYGNTAAGAQPTIGFTGHVNDADTGLTYMQQRYYDPVAGRFLSIDPVTTDITTGAGFNRYAYANNSPFRYTDPDGRVGIDIAFVAYDIYAIATEGATAVNVGALALDAASTVGLGFGAGQVFRAAHAVEAVAHSAEAAKVTAKELRGYGKADFEASKAAALKENGGKCVYCNSRDATQGDHLKPLKAFAGDVNSGKMTKAEAIRQANAPENIVGACGGTGGCNQIKSGNTLSGTPGPGKYVPPNPTPKIMEKMK